MTVKTTFLTFYQSLFLLEVKTSSDVEELNGDPLEWSVCIQRNALNVKLKSKNTYLFINVTISRSSLDSFNTRSMIYIKINVSSLCKRGLQVCHIFICNFSRECSPLLNEPTIELKMANVMRISTRSVQCCNTQDRYLKW